MRLGRGSPNTINDHLDDWWTKLGARLRDLPGHEFPHLPERVAHTLQQLWNEALDGAQVALQGTLAHREQMIAEQEQALQTREQKLIERERTSTARATALEESLTLAREQLAAANRRASSLERSLQERENECARLRTRIEVLDVTVSELHAKLNAASIAHITPSGISSRSVMRQLKAAGWWRWIAPDRG
jgi:DNA repair exonuclease SbcCD ATPase subunit